MKTIHVGLTLAAVLAARLTLGQEAPPSPPPSEPIPTEPSPPAEPAPPPAEPPPGAPSETPPGPAEPPPTAPSSTAAFPTPPPTAPSASAAFPVPPPPPPAASASAAPSAKPATAPTADQKKEQSKQVDALAKKDKPVEETDDTHGVFGPFRIGPVIGVGLPAFFSFGGAVKLTKYFGAGINYGIVPTLQFAYYGDATVQYQGVGIYGHIHPFGGGFFLGASIGYAHVRGTYEEEFNVSAYVPGLDSFPYTSEATMQTLVLTPELGYFFTFKSGFTLGVEAGLQIPVAPSEIHFKSKVNLPGNVPPEVEDQVEEKFIAPTDERVESTLEKLGQTMLPTLGIKVGWLF